MSNAHRESGDERSAGVATRAQADSVLQAPYRHDAASVAEALEVDPAAGLDDGEVQRRRRTHGRNELADPPRRAPWRRFLDQFRSLLILILLAAAVLAGLVGDVKDTVVILVVLLVNATIGFVQENRAERSLEALKSMLTPTSRVRRDGRVAVVDAASLVPGDIVLVEAGDRVPADGRIVQAESLEVDESALTGESQPVAKTADVPAEAHAGDRVALAERTDMLFMNTAVTRGKAQVVLTATGMQTEVGAIAAQLSGSHEPPSPLQLQIDSVGKRIALIGGCAVALYAVVAVLQGQDLGQLALSAVALAVATVPEGLPAVLALTLALGVSRMARQGAIVKRLASVETLGSATVVCTDKTGTLTLNQMTARAVSFAGHLLVADGEGYQPTGSLRNSDTGRPVDAGLLAELRERLLLPAALCSDAVLSASGAGIIGDPTEGALVVLATKAGLDVDSVRAEHPRAGEVPFDAARKYMATAHPDPADTDRLRVYVKGAPDVLLALATTVVTAAGVERLDDTGRDRSAREIAALAGRGLRVLGAAATTVNRPTDGDVSGHVARNVGGLTLLGFVGIADPPRPEAAQAVAVARRAGIDVKMITGDHRDTAAAIAAEIGIPGRVLTGADLDATPADRLAATLDDVGVLARVSPEHKVAVVRALTSRGHVVAMTGDGVNDAAALRSAHIGVAMGITGTEVTKEAGAMILTDDNFATIVKAVREGRAIFDNVVKFVRFQLSTNIGAILSFLGCAVAGLPAPLNAIQVLWVNIIMDGPPAMALGVDPARPGIMDQPPRATDARILGRTRLTAMFRTGLVMAAITVGVLVLARGPYGEAVALTMAFTTFVVAQFFNALNARAEAQTVFTRHLTTNRWLWVSLSAVIVLQVAVVQLPALHGIFGTTALDLQQWLVCAALASLVLWVEEAVKAVTRLTSRPRPGTSASVPPVRPPKKQEPS